MARKPQKKPRKAATPAAGDIFEHFAAHNPGYSEEEAPTRASNDRGGDQLSTLLARIEGLERQNQELMDFQRRVSLAPARHSEAPSPRQEEEAPANLDLSGMPDPIEKVAEYNAELSRRVAAYVQLRERAASKTANAGRRSEETAEQLWSDFSTKYPEWAKHKDLVGVMATKVARKAAAKGINTEAYMGAASDLFFKDVISELEASGYSRLIQRDDEEEDEVEEDFIPEAPQNRGPAKARNVEEEDDGRTAGIFGGQESGGRPVKGAQSGKTDMLQDLRDIQSRTGFF